MLIRSLICLLWRQNIRAGLHRYVLTHVFCTSGETSICVTHSTICHMFHGKMESGGKEPPFRGMKCSLGWGASWKEVCVKKQGEIMITARKGTQTLRGRNLTEQ